MSKLQSARNGRVPIRGVIFDYGNVICHTQKPSDMEAMAQVCGIAVPRFRELYWKFRLPYDRGDISAEAYWQAASSEEGLVLTQAQIAKLIDLDTQGWARENEKTLQWVEQLYGAGIRLGLLSNMPSDLSQYLIANGGWVSRFHHLTFSCEVRMVKPDPAIYQACLDSLGVAAAETLFLDDLAPNIEAAAKLGIHGVLFDTVEQTAARVAERFDLPAPDFAGAHTAG